MQARDTNLDVLHNGLGSFEGATARLIALAAWLDPTHVPVNLSMPALRCLRRLDSPLRMRTPWACSAPAHSNATLSTTPHRHGSRMSHTSETLLWHSNSCFASIMPVWTFVWAFDAFWQCKRSAHEAKCGGVRTLCRLTCFSWWLFSSSSSIISAASKLFRAVSLRSN